MSKLNKNQLEKINNKVIKFTVKMGLQREQL